MMLALAITIQKAVECDVVDEHIIIDVGLS